MGCSNEVLYIPACEESLKPFKGKIFTTLNEGVNFYKEYAKNVGFDTRLSHAKRVGDLYTWSYVVCNREGEKYVVPESGMKASGDVNSKIRRRVSSRCGCNAKVVFKYVAYLGYVIDAFIEEHKHELVEVEYRQFMRINRKLDSTHQQFILDCAKSNIGPTACHRLLSEILGGSDVIGSSVMEVRNFSRDLKAFVNGCDAQMLLNEMRKKKQFCDSFVYEYEIDAEDKLTKLFWCDPISKRNYHLFGDIVAFDTTYSTNKYCMIFAPFTGKDNHGKPVSFGAGMLCKEDAASFSWLFEKFIVCMGSRPRLIITDQDLGMKVAVERVLTGTRHRWCMWHIMLKLADKISKELRANKTFRKELNRCVWSELIESDFFYASWGSIMEKYGLAADAWFMSMFENRNFWVPAYFRNFPMSDLVRTTSISEYENEAQRYHNARFNYLDKSFFPSLSTDLAIEKHAASVYTEKIFRSVQEEILASLFKCRMKNMFQSDGKEFYTVVDEYEELYDVYYDVHSSEYICKCNMFGRMGLLCCHVYFVLRNRDVMSIPDKYIAGRWKKAHLMEPVHSMSHDDFRIYANIDENKRLVNNVMSSVYGWVQKLDGDVVKMSNFIAAIDNAGRSLTGEEDSELMGDKRQIFQKFYGADVPERVDVLPPDPVKTKGSGRRMKSRIEKAVNLKKKPKRRCATCKEMVYHDSRNCGKVKKSGSITM